MFNKKVNQRIRDVDKRVEAEGERWRDRYNELRGDFDRLVAALGLVQQVTHKIEYVKKGGPEKE